jgi:predicted O-linked N-acetylglucosamine transferase (SPINDLY family)
VVPWGEDIGMLTPSNHLQLDAQSLPDALLEIRQLIDIGHSDQARARLSQELVGPIMAASQKAPLVALGCIYQDLHQWDRAQDSLTKALACGPDTKLSRLLGHVLRLGGYFSQAAACYQRALVHDPDHVPLQIAYGLALMRLGQMDDGLGRLKQVVDEHPTLWDAHSKYLFHSHYQPQPNPAAHYEAHTEWGRRHAPSALACHVYSNDPDRDRILRVGYMGADFHRHSAAYNFEAALSAHRSDQVTTYGYVSVASPDDVTKRFERLFDHSVNIHDKDDMTVVKQIREDEIDVLVFLSGHTGGHRLTVAAYKPAPIQVDYGSMNTTGIRQIDYRVTDAVLDPAGIDAYYTETLVRMAKGFWCYCPPEPSPSVTSLPAQTNGHVTYGSFNNAMKINSSVLALWAQLLQQCPGDRLVIQCGGGADPVVRERFFAYFDQQGICSDRIDIIGWLTFQDHFKVRAQVDVALDPFPFSGAITTLESLWMGVPTVCLAGSTFVSRMSKGILERCGLGFCVASHTQEYLEIARELGGNLERLKDLRHSMRMRVKNSDLCNAPAHTQELEAHYRAMWVHWCEQQVNQGITAPRSADRASGADCLTFSVIPTSDLHFDVFKQDVPPKAFDVLKAIERGDVDTARAGMTDTLVHAFIEVTRTHRSRTDLLFLLGVIWSRLEESDQAIDCFQRVLSRMPHALVYFELGTLYKHRGQLAQATKCFHQATRLSPDSHELWTTLADALIMSGRSTEGLAILRRVVAKQPDRINHSKYLWHLHQDGALDQKELLREHVTWAHLHAPMELVGTGNPHSLDRNRRLRIGYLSPDFCGHSVAYFFEPLLENHHPDQVQSFGYGNVSTPDQVTDRLRDRFDVYHSICGTDDAHVAHLIEQDGIDILVELAGHTGGNRLGVLARKPAPIQVCYLGYPDTTGMSQVDYRFTDEWADVARADACYTETLCRLKTGFLCYRPPGFAPDVGPLPAERNGYVTFGSFNNNTKINASTIRRWGRILTQLPDARLVLKFRGGDDPSVAQHYQALFQAAGVAPDRIRLVGRLSVLEHLTLYNDIDLALDTFPYAGTTTTCEALWMGVPTVSLVGIHHASRVGLSLLTRVGMEVFCAQSPEEYVGKAVQFAREPGNLAQIRRVTRAMMLGSRLCDGKAYARAVEAAYREMWQRYVTKCGDGTTQEMTCHSSKGVL